MLKKKLSKSILTNNTTLFLRKKTIANAKYIEVVGKGTFLLVFSLLKETNLTSK